MSSAPPSRAAIQPTLYCPHCGNSVGSGLLLEPPRAARQPARSDADKLQLVLDTLHQLNLKLPEFLDLLLAQHPHGSPSRSPEHAGVVSSFLGGHTTISARAIVQRMYDNHDSRPSGRNAVDSGRVMARAQLQDWAYEITLDQFVREATALTDVRTGQFLRMDKMSTSWDRIQSFSLSSIRQQVAVTAPHIWRSFLMLATPTRTLKAARAVGAGHALPGHQSATPTAESHPHEPQRRRHDPWIIALFAILVLMVSRNLHVNFFQKVVSVWLFANSAPYDMYGILCRFGLALSYSGTLGIMRRLSSDAERASRLLAHTAPFGIIYDNINRLRRRYTALFGQGDEMQNGAASIILRLVNFVWTALDIRAYFRARDERRRAALTLKVLEQRIPAEHLRQISIAHALDILVQHTPPLLGHHARIMEMFRVDLARHRVSDSQPTEFHPLATSDCNVGTTPGTRDALDDIFIDQLGMDPETVSNLLRIVCGDQGSIEKIRTLKRYLQSCPHGYAQYEWVFPLVQLWHMGWADLARILKTHWGAHASDGSGFNAIIQAIGSKVTKKDRPDHRPTLRLITQTLHGDILACWRQVLGTENLEEYFTERTITFEELCTLAETLHRRYLSSEAEERARVGGDLRDPSLSLGPTLGETSSSSSAATAPTVPPTPVEHRASPHLPPPSHSSGDSVLADWMLRMRDCLLQVEFQYAIADGDIGRVLAVMAVWVFMFAGCGASKYATELIELVCQFEYELPENLRNSILNNWLANPSGRSGGWIPLDLLLERLIRMLKKLADRRDTTFGANFYRTVVSRNVRGLLAIKDNLRSALGLAPRSKRHGSKRDAAIYAALELFNKENHLPQFCEGRSEGTASRNDFQKGHAHLRDGRLAEILMATMQNIPPPGHQMPLYDGDDVSDGEDSDYKDISDSDSSDYSSVTAEESSDESIADGDGDVHMNDM